MQAFIHWLFSFAWGKDQVVGNPSTVATTWLYWRVMSPLECPP
jgi:hypothetical protein